MITKKEVIYNLKDQLNSIKEEDMDKASWGYEEGVLLTGNEAKAILDILEV